MSLMGYKTFLNPKAFSGAEKYGIRITTYTETFSAAKAKVGFGIGAISIVSVLFGLFAVKLVNIPLFLTFRRCAIIATIIVQYIIDSKVPSRNLSIAATLMVTGAIIAGYETLDSDMFGYFLIWGNNFVSALQFVFTSNYNADKKVTPFEINFFFACIGLPLMLAITIYTEDIWTLYDIFLVSKNVELGT